MDFCLSKSIGTAKIQGHVYDSESKEDVENRGSIILILPVANRYKHIDRNGHYMFDNLPAGIPISGIAGDQQAALFGQACFKEGTIKNTYGTGCFVLLNTGKKRIWSKYGLITTIGCGCQGEPVYVLEGAIFIAGAAIQWLRDGLKILTSATESEKMARAVKDNAGVYFVIVDTEDTKFIRKITVTK